MHVSFAHLIPEDRESSLLRRYYREVRYVLETSASLFSASFQMRSQLDHTLPSIATIPVSYRALCCHLHNLGTTISCDLLTCPLTSTSHFLFHSLALHQMTLPSSSAGSSDARSSPPSSPLSSITVSLYSGNI